MTHLTHDPSTNLPEGDKHIVGVYGTLKQGQCRAGALSTSKYLGRGRLNATLCTWPSYPFIVLYSDIPPDHPAKAFCQDKWTVCEVYEVDRTTLRILDGIESHPNYYRRQLVPLTGAFNGMAWVYTLAPDKYLRGRLKVCRLGNWEGYINTPWVEVDFFDGKQKPRILTAENRAGTALVPVSKPYTWNPNSSWEDSLAEYDSEDEDEEEDTEPVEVGIEIKEREAVPIDAKGTDILIEGNAEMAEATVNLCY